MGKIYVFLLLLLIISSCNTTGTLIEYEVLKPSRQTIPPEIKSLVLVNNSYPFERTDVHIAMVNGKKQYLDTIVFPEYPDTLLYTLKQNLLDRQFFDTVYYDTTRYNIRKRGVKFKNLDDNQVQEICDKYGADAVLALEGYTYGTKVDVTEWPDAYFSTMAVHGMTFWRMYDAYNNTIVFDEVQNDTIYWDGVGASMHGSLSSFPALMEANDEYALYVADEFVKYIVPEWEKVQRRLYIEGSGMFAAAAEWLDRKNTEEAKKIWGYLFEHGKKIEKARAAHNIAIVLEREGDIINALKWAFNSYDIYIILKQNLYGEESKDAKNYYLYLAQRKGEINKLKQQIGSE